MAQIPAHAAEHELFGNDYGYFSSVSQSWLAHARKFVDDVSAQFNLDENSFVFEVASNDGYLLQYFHEPGVRCVGIDPTHSTDQEARKNGIETVEYFLGAETAQQIVSEYSVADLVPANNVFAHVPDINDFAASIAKFLAPQGVATIEFPTLLSILNGCQFDTIYHEHYSYLFAFIRIECTRSGRGTF